MNIYIKAISYFLPEQKVSNEELLREFPEWSGDKVAAKVGVFSRHIAKDNETAGDLAEKAAKQLFVEHNIDPKSIDFVILCTQSSDYALPSTACILQHKLGIPTSAGALDYNLGCSGCVYGLAIAKGLISARIAQNVLLLTAETYTKYLHPDDKSNRTIFGDGAAACLVSTSGMAEIGDFVLGTDGSGAKHLILETGGARERDKAARESKDDDDHIVRSDYLYMNGSAIFNFTLGTVPVMLKQVCEKHALRKEDIDYYIFHQANKFMLDTLRKVCTLPKDKVLIQLDETGNTVSSTILIGLKQCLDDGTIHAGMNVLLAGFGVGLSWGATLIKF